MNVDLCIVGGRIFDGRVRTGDTAVAVAGGRVVAVGSDPLILGLADGRTRVVDAAGGLIHPGFVDAHTHAAFAGVERLSLDLTGARSRDETFELITRYAVEAHEEWITGGGWIHELFEHPTRQMLDALVPDRPVALSDAGHHTLWVNSKALEAAGITRETPDPPNGMIHRDEAGEPTGYLNESAANLFNTVIPPASTQMIKAGIRNAQEHLHSIGVTGWHDPTLGEFNGKADATDAYLETLADGTLASLVSGALWVPAGTTVEEVPGLVEQFIERRRRNAAGGLPTSFAKLMVDGVPHGETAALLEPYHSHAEAEHFTGATHVTPEALKALVVAMDAAGFGMHLHVMGDRGVRDALDAIEEARRVNGPGVRHQIAHLSMVSPADARRFGPLGVTANMQALWATVDPAVVPMIGEERMLAGYPFRSLADSGAELAMGSDWPVSPADPWMAIHVAVNRTITLPDGSVPPPLNPAQALTLGEALAAYTSGSSQLALGVAGRLRVGERADLVVENVDPFALLAEALASVRTEVTVVNGQVVYERREDVAEAVVPGGELQDVGR